MKPIQVGDVVKVKWEDAYGDPGWADTPEKHTPHIVTSIGKIIFDDDRGILLAGSWSETQMGDRSFIPRGMVRKVTRVR